MAILKKQLALYFCIAFLLSAVSVEAIDVVGIKSTTIENTSSDHQAVIYPDSPLFKKEKKKRGFFKRLKQKVAQKRIAKLLQPFLSDSLGCDVIVLKSGEEIEAKVMEVNTGAVLYKLCEQEDGPRRTLLNSKVFMIKYADGYKEVFKKDEDDMVISEKSPPRRNVRAIGFVLGLLLGLIGVLIVFAIYYNDRYERRRATGAAWLGILAFVLLILALGGF